MNSSLIKLICCDSHLFEDVATGPAETHIIKELAFDEKNVSHSICFDKIQLLYFIPKPGSVLKSITRTRTDDDDKVYIPNTYDNGKYILDNVLKADKQDIVLSVDSTLGGILGIKCTFISKPPTRQEKPKTVQPNSFAKGLYDAMSVIREKIDHISREETSTVTCTSGLFLHHINNNDETELLCFRPNPGSILKNVKVEMSTNLALNDPLFYHLPEMLLKCLEEADGTYNFQKFFNLMPFVCYGPININIESTRGGLLRLKARFVDEILHNQRAYNTIKTQLYTFRFVDYPLYSPIKGLSIDPNSCEQRLHIPIGGYGLGLFVLGADIVNFDLYVHGMKCLSFNKKQISFLGMQLRDKAYCFRLDDFTKQNYCLNSGACFTRGEFDIGLKLSTPTNKLQVGVVGINIIHFDPVMTYLRPCTKFTTYSAFRFPATGSPLTKLANNSFAEGYWYDTNQKSKNYPLPIETKDPVSEEWITKLEKVTNSVFVTTQKCLGYSKCRVCNKDNGSQEHFLHFNGTSFRYPEGILHYYKKHGVQPSTKFTDIINASFEAL